MIKLFFLALAITILPFRLLAQWHELPGPSGGSVNDFCEIAGSNGGRIYAATPNGVYRTTDHATSWQSVGLAMRDVQKITQYQLAGQEILLTAVSDPDGWHLCRSLDSAKTWDTAFTSKLQDPIVEILQDGNDIVAAVQGGFDSVCGIYRSTDLGGHWSHQAKVPVPLFFLDCTIGNGMIFAIADSGLNKQVWSISSHGATWSETNYPYWHHASSIHMSGGDLFVGGYGRIDISTDNGISWLPVPNAGLDTASDAFLSFAVAGTTIVANSSEAIGTDEMFTYGIFRTTDGGATWEHIESTGGYPKASSTRAIQFIDNRFFAGADAGVLASSDGVNWKYATDGLVGPVEDVIEYSGILFGVTPRGVFHSSDHGTSWTVPVDSADLLDSLASGFAEVGSDLYAYGSIASGLGGTALWKWTGTQWETVLDERVGYIAEQNNTLYVPLFNSGPVERSTDSGGTWSPIKNGLPTGESAELVFSAHGKLFIVGYEYLDPNGHELVYASTDNGASFSELAILSIGGPACSAASFPNAIYIATKVGLALSTDDGVTWTSSKEHTVQVRARGPAAIVTTTDSIYAINGNQEFKLLADSVASSLHAFTSDDQFAYAATISRGLWAAPLTSLPLAVGSAPVASTSIRLSIYPNPSNGSATIAFTLPEREAVTLRLYDEKGVALTTLFDGFAQGDCSIPFDASRLPEGTYVAVLSTSHGSEVGRFVIERRSGQ